MIPDIATFPSTLPEIRRALVRHSKIGLSCFGGVLGLALLGAIFMPRTYLSEAKVFVRFGRENLAVDPSATTGQVLSVNETRENEINSLLEVMRSRALLDAVADRIGPENILHNRLPNHQPDLLAADDPLLAATGMLEAEPASVQVSLTGTTISPHELTPPDKSHMRAVQWLEKNVFIDAPRRSSVIVIGAKAASPALAQRVVAEITDLYLREHTLVHSKADSYEFFLAETDKLQREWNRATQAWQAAKDECGVVTIEGQRALLESHLQDLQQRQTANAAALAQSNARIASLQTQLASLPDVRVASSAEVPNLAADQMRSSYFQVQLEAMELASRLDESHPLVQAAQQRVKDGAQALALVNNSREQTTTETHPARKALEVTLLDEQANRQSQIALQKSLQEQLVAAHADLKAWGEQEAKIALLQRDVELAGNFYRNAADKLEQARISRELDTQRITNLRLVQPASYSDTPTGPGRKLVLLLGGFVATLGGLGLPLGLAWLKPQWTSLEDIAHGLDLPVVARVQRATRTTAAATSIAAETPTQV